MVRTDLSAGGRSQEDDAAERNEKGRGQLHVGQAGRCVVQATEKEGVTAAGGVKRQFIDQPIYRPTGSAIFPFVQPMRHGGARHHLHQLK